MRRWRWWSGSGTWGDRGWCACTYVGLVKILVIVVVVIATAAAAVIVGVVGEVGRRPVGLCSIDTSPYLKYDLGYILDAYNSKSIVLIYMLTVCLLHVILSMWLHVRGSCYSVEVAFTTEVEQHLLP